MTKIIFGFLLLLGYICFSEFFVRSQEDVSKSDVHDAEVRLKSDLLKNYTKDVLPPHNSSSPVVISTGMSLIAIIDLDAKTQTLTSEAWLKLIWKDSRLSWNAKDYAGIDVIRMATHKVWQPDIELYNSAKMREMEMKPDVFLLLYPEGTVVWIPPISFYSLCEVDLRYYPYDRHNCTYKFGSWTHDGHHLDMELYMDEKRIALEDAWNTGGEWEIINTFALKTSRFYACCSEPYVDVTFSVILQRRSPFYKVVILCPLIVSSFLILASFWMSAASYQRVMLNVLSFFTVVALLMHLSTKLPAVGNNCPIVMILCGILMMMSASASAISIIFVLLARSKSNEQTPEWVKKLVQSPIMKIFCVAIPTYDNVESNGVDYSLHLVPEDDSKDSRSSAIFKPNTCMMLFTLIDRLLFLICFIIITAVMISASA